MLSKAENELLTRVGPGTPMGDLMRRYWHPIAAAGELDNPFRLRWMMGNPLRRSRSKEAVARQQVGQGNTAQTAAELPEKITTIHDASLSSALGRQQVNR